MRAIINLSAKSPVMPEFPPYGVCILESRHTEGFLMPSSCYDFSEVMLILDGKGWLTTGKVRHPVEKGNLVAMPSGTTYSYTDSADAPLAMLSLCIAPSSEMAAAFRYVLPLQFMIFRNAPFTREVVPHFRSILNEQSLGVGAGVPVVIAHSLLILSKVHRRYGAAARDEEHESANVEVQLLARVRDYIAKLEMSFHESETIRTVSERLGMSPRSFTDYFRHVTGLSRHQYIQKLRLRRAMRLLAESDESVTSIAFSCGFEDLSNFFRAFRKEAKVSPNQWRLNSRGEAPPEEHA